MKPFGRMLKTLAVRFSLAPLDALAEVGRRFLPAQQKNRPATESAQALKAPLILQIETTNACNARCIFCVYPELKRQKGIMSLPLFEKIINDYKDMGGGPVSLTPIMGDPLLDPHLLTRIRLLEDNSGINQLSLSTNAIALDKFSDAEVSGLLQSLAVLQVSIGGLDEKTYREMYGVDRFAQVRKAMDRLLELNREVSEPAEIAFAFRTNDWKFERRYRKDLDAFRRQGVQVSHIWTYSNYGGLVESDKGLGLEVNEGPPRKGRPCALAAIHLAVCWDGTVTACGCADAEGRGLVLGHADRDSLEAVWTGEKRRSLLKSFEAGNLPEVCRKCSAYREDTILAEPGLGDVRPGKPLPMDFYHKFWGA